LRVRRAGWFILIAYILLVLLVITPQARAADTSGTGILYAYEALERTCLSQPSDYTDVVNKWDNETSAYDWNNETNADESLGHITSDIYWHTWNNTAKGAITQVDLAIRIDLTGLSDDTCMISWYVRAAQGSGTYEINSGNQGNDLVVTFADVVEPNDATWNWTDIGDLEIRQVGERSVGFDSIDYHTDEVWAYISVEAIPASQNEDGNYPVFPNTDYHFCIDNITEYEDAEIRVYARYRYNSTEYTDFLGNFSLGARPSNATFSWTIPNLPVTHPPIAIKFSYHVPMLGDADRDGDIDASDIRELSEAYGSDPAEPNWNPVLDCNGDDILDIHDLANVSIRYGPYFYWARGDAGPAPYPPRLLLVVPEVPLGALGALAALFLGLKLKGLIRIRKE